jgi:hypothetical protein
VAKSILPTLGGTPMAWNTRLRGTEVVDLIEAEGARDDRFTWALGKMCIVAKGLPPDVVERIVIASGNAIRQLGPRKFESRACYQTNVAADKRSSGCAWLCHALLLTRLQLNFGVRRLPGLRASTGIPPLRLRFPTNRDGAGFIRTMRLTLALGLAAVSLPAAAALGQVQPEPPWRTRLMPWVTHAGQPRPWRSDVRLARYTAPGYPDDFQVLFPSPDSAAGGRPEVMWVRVIAVDSASGHYLGILLNQPHALKIPVMDNVVFRVDGTGGLPVAVGGPDYSDAGWPASRAPEFLASLRSGIRAYREGNNGHNMPGIERCIQVLTSAMRTPGAGVAREERFVGHFVLGRCLAEKYETEHAIDQFRAAIALDSADLDAHMALLAELSIMTHYPPGKFAAATEERWEREFVEQLQLVRSRFAGEAGVQQILAMVFDAAQEDRLEPVWQPHVAKLRRIGYAVFRWKQR